jgi:phosphoserine phosphatase RsbU/P
MTAPLLAILSLAFFAGVGFAVVAWIARSQRHKLVHLRHEQEDLVGTERRMFSYLHDLGAAIASEQREVALHKMIVEGAMKVTASRGGAIYTFDEGTGTLVPRFISGDVAALVPLSESQLAQEKVSPGSMLNGLRLNSAPDRGALLGDVFQEQRSEHVQDLGADERLAAGANNQLQDGNAALIGPLSSGPRKLGILAVTLPNTERGYDVNDLEVFTALAEQSAFALASAVAHQEVQSKRQLEAEYRIAGEVQRILLPEEDPSLDGYEVVGKNRPARFLSGDFYDYVQPRGGGFGVAIADVSGKGMPAALIAATCRSALQAFAGEHASPAAVLGLVNRQIFDDLTEDMFVSALYLVLDEQTGVVKWARAGHAEPMLWRQATGEVEVLHQPGLGLGIDQGDVFERVTKDREFTLQPGDCLLIYTDGVNEAENAEGEMFGEERMHQVLAEHGATGSAQVVGALLAAVHDFTGGRQQSDDITVVALKRRS